MEFKQLVTGLAALAIVGCASQSTQNTAFKTIGGVETTGKTMFDDYCTLVINGTLATNSVPQVSAAYNQLQADCILAATVASQGTNGLASTSLTADLGALTTVISTTAHLK